MHHQATPDPTSYLAQLSRVLNAVDHMSNLEGQDRTLVIEMSQAMLTDILTEDDGLRPLVEYVRRYCDVIDSEADAERIAGEI